MTAARLTEGDNPVTLRGAVHLHRPTSPAPVCGAPVPTDRARHLTAYRSDVTCPACRATQGDKPVTQHTTTPRGTAVMARTTLPHLSLTNVRALIAHAINETDAAAVTKPSGADYADRIISTLYTQLGAYRRANLLKRMTEWERAHGADNPNGVGR